MIKTIFFDLDWCILNTDPMYRIFSPIMDIVESAPVSEEVKEKYRKSLRGISNVENLNEFPSDVADKLITTYKELKVPDDIRTYGDEGCIPPLGTTNFLVTTGFPKFQQQKIDKIGIAHMFEDIYIDELDGEFHHSGKESVFRKIIEKHSLSSHEILVVGDKGPSELMAGKNLGIKTVQTLRPKIEKWEGANYYIESLCELKDILKELR